MANKKNFWGLTSTAHRITYAHWMQGRKAG